MIWIERISKHVTSPNAFGRKRFVLLFGARFLVVMRCTASPFSTAGFARMVERAGNEAKLSFKPHPHMLRHACGYALANKGHDTRALQAYLGHRNIQHTVRYTELSPTRFKDFWRR